MAKLEPEIPPPDGFEPPKFSQLLTSPIVAVTVAKTRTFYLHFKLLTAESDRFSKGLMGEFKEAETKSIELVDEDPELFGFFVEYLYRDSLILSREIQHYSDRVTLARLYAMGERLSAPTFKAHCFWRFSQSLSNQTVISDEGIFELLRIACTEITERLVEDPMRAHIFWYAGVKITNLQKSSMFRQLLYDIPDLGRYLCLWVGQNQPKKPDMPNVLSYHKLAPESEYSLQRSSGAA